MKRTYTLLGLTLGIALNTQAQNVGINTDGSTPDGDAILHIKNDASSSKDSSVVRIENEQNGANDVTGVEIYNSGTGATAKWDVYIPASGSTDLRFKNNGTDRITIQNDGDVGIGTTSPVSGLDVQTSLGYAVATITSATTLDQTHNAVLCNTGPYTVTLPAAAANTGKVYYIKNIDADGDDITIDGNGSETIDDGLVYTLETYKQAIRIISDGTNWHILEESGLSLRVVTNPCGDTLYLGNGTYTIITTANPAEYCNCDGTPFEWNDVISPNTGETWMDRNLGASQVATSSTDADSYGDLFQWGRAADGHQCRNSATTTTLSTTDAPSHGDFIIIDAEPNDWLNPQNDSLWQGLSGTNNPCPSGYRVPTNAEWWDELSYTPLGAHIRTGSAFTSFLILPTAGIRNRHNGSITTGLGAFWSSTIDNDGRGAWVTAYSTSWGNIGYGYGYWQRADGLSIRCIKD